MASKMTTIERRGRFVLKHEDRVCIMDNRALFPTDPARNDDSHTRIEVSNEGPSDIEVIRTNFGSDSIEDSRVVRPGESVLIDVMGNYRVFIIGSGGATGAAIGTYSVRFVDVLTG